MAFLRLTRDRRGYENTFLLHSPYPGARPVVLYWYRSAPGVRVGRPALDEDAIRTIEEQHPHIDFDWPHILEVGAIVEPEVERRPPLRQKRRPAPAPAPVVKSPAPAAPPREAEEPPAADDALVESVLAAEAALAEADASLVAEALGSADEDDAFDEAAADELSPPPARPHDLLEELVGHEIATRLHARYSEIISRVHRLPESHPQRAAFEARAESLNPDNWVTPDEVLRGVSRADTLFDSLRQELLAH